jgi:hypothetical protein
MKFINKKETESKWITIGKAWKGKTKKEEEYLSIQWNTAVSFGAKEQISAFINPNAGMGIERNGKKILNKNGKQLVEADYNICILEDNIEE